MAKVNSIPDIAYLSECFELAHDGTLFWKERPRSHFSVEAAWRTFNGRNAGHVAGTNQGSGYLVVCAGYRRMYAHRVVYALTNGAWPTGEVDHIDGNRSNNRPSNLRQADRQQQLMNTARSSANSSGHKGVSSCKDKWRAYIVVGRKQKHLGVFSTPELAAQAYQAASVALFGEYACSDR